MTFVFICMTFSFHKNDLTRLALKVTSKLLSLALLPLLHYAKKVTAIKAEL